jgi:hypothetical protein
VRKTTAKSRAITREINKLLSKGGNSDKPMSRKDWAEYCRLDMAREAEELGAKVVSEVVLP